jgi:hypothetical protein
LSLLLRAQEPRDELLHALRPHLDLSQPSEIHRHLLAAHGSEIKWLVRLLRHLIMLQLVLLEAVAQGVLLQVADVLEGDLGLLECRRDHRTYQLVKMRQQFLNGKVFLNTMEINVTATADFQTNFRIFYGENPNEVPETFLEGETKTHVYTNPGTYQVRVFAVSGSAQSAVPFTRMVTVTRSVLLLLPIDFESTTIPYTFLNFDNTHHPNHLLDLKLVY